MAKNNKYSFTMGEMDGIITNIISYQKILGYYDNGSIPKSSNPIRKNGIIFYLEKWYFRVDIIKQASPIGNMVLGYNWKILSV